MANPARSTEADIDEQTDLPNDNQPPEDHVEAPANDGADDEAVTERRARAQGWRPLDEYRGNPARWVDAKTFLDRGYGNPEILRERIDRIADKLEERDTQINELNTRVAESGQVLRSLNDRFINADRDGYKRGRADAEARMRKAAAEADTEAYDEAKADLDALEAAPPAVARPAPVVTQPAAPARPAVDPVVQAWVDEPDHSWFNENKRLQRAAVTLHKTYVEDNPKAAMQASLDYVDAEIRRLYPSEFENPRRSAPGGGGARQPSGDRGNGGARTNGKMRWQDLTKEEQDAADMFVRSIPPTRGKDGKPQSFTREEYLEHYAQEAAKDAARSRGR